MNIRNTLVCLLALVFPTISLADPCGMVPPIYPGKTVPLARVGEQRTYVFYQNGVESFVIRPGFTGKVEEFGMLIPFPTPPAVRKIADDVFEHVAKSVDPPEVVVNLQFRDFAFGNNAAEPSNQAVDSFAVESAPEAVRVIREEAVGMYEVAVLEAGSAAALNKWMDEHGYKYPDGMDEPCEDYVKAGWCFVAVKTRVGAKSGVEAKPGQRNVKAELPAGSSFDGYVQAMGFRFKSEELVVPMRLSAFNKGDLRNIVYLLSDSPKKIRAIPEEYVVRQIAGKQLLNNVSQPLPLRIIGGTEKDIPDYRRKSLPQERDPAPHNGIAKELYAADMLAVASQELSLPQEEHEKVLLRIGERFGLRGADIDRINAEAMKAQRKDVVMKGIASLKDMTLTVIDGDFPREVLASTNLSFGEYRMPASRNNAKTYDAKTKSPAAKRQGVLRTGELNFESPELNESRPAKSVIGWLLSLGGLAIAIAGGVFFALRK